MPFSRTRRTAAASAWPLVVLVLVLFPVMAVHGVGGALTHGHPDSALGHSASAEQTGAAAQGVHSLTVAHEGAGPTGHGGHHHAAGADGAANGHAQAGEPHSHADCMSVAPSAGLLSLVCWPAFLTGGPRALAPSPPRVIAIRGRRRRARLRRTRLRLAELSILRI
ncbi:hypothetical protein FZ103_21685 [Streptomonospora sp. PA3]|uniref:hypothetical protein n=1 Tax=Streptomonospora sp. PA3 TaxID=2607326 RepID=UPI0012DC5D01|nr:hypothetical protein [Streptomonospora sp. PA3]MUL43743.1 hypothetical protein [Streptomonospora sp. PA3]